MHALIMASERLNPVDKLVLLAILAGNSMIRVAAICKRTALSDRQVRESTKRMAQLGVLEITPCNREGATVCNRYLLNNTWFK